MYSDTSPHKVFSGYSVLNRHSAALQNEQIANRICSIFKIDHDRARHIPLLLRHVRDGRGAGDDQLVDLEVLFRGVELHRRRLPEPDVSQQ